MPPKKRGAKSTGSAVLKLSADQEASIRDRMSNKPCINCDDHHEAWDCHMLQGPLPPMTWIYRIFPKPAVRAAGRRYVGTLQKDRAAGLKATAVGVPASSSTVDAGPVTPQVDAGPVTPQVDAGPAIPQVDGVSAAVENLSVGSSSAGAPPQVEEPKVAQGPVGEVTNVDSYPDDIAYAHNSDPPPADLLRVSRVAQSQPVDTELPHKTDPPKIELTDLMIGGNKFKPKHVPCKDPLAPFPLRKTLATTSMEVYTNNFEVRFKTGSEFFVYQIAGVPGSKSKARLEMVVKTVVQAWDFLKKNENHFAVDGTGLIVSWKDLHSSLGTPDHVGEKGHGDHTGDDDNAVDLQWSENMASIADGKSTLSPIFKYCGKLAIDKFMAYIDPSRPHTFKDLPRFDFSVVVNALNVVVAKNMTNDVFQLGANKFFVKSGYESLSKSLCTMRGYFYTIRPGMGTMLLSVNAATSAFYQPILVSEFMGDDTFPSYERESALKTKKVYIVHTRLVPSGADKVMRERTVFLNTLHKRVKSVFSFGKPIRDLSFFDRSRDPPGNTRVIDHMLRVFGKRPNPALKAVNVGDKDNEIWLPQEFLRILPYQLYRKIVPEKLTDKMLKSAAHTPVMSRSLIEAEGLLKLGISQPDNVRPFAKCPQLFINPRMLQIPATIMKAPKIFYYRAQRSPNDRAQWNLGPPQGPPKGSLRGPPQNRGGGNLKFIHSPKRTQGLRYYMLFDEKLGDPNTKGIYQTSFAKQVAVCGVGSGATCIGEMQMPTKRFTSHEQWMEWFGQSVAHLLHIHPGGSFVMMLLQTKSSSIYPAFKDVIDRFIGIQSICTTAKPNCNQYGRCNPGIDPYMANVVMKANLKTGGKNHTAAGDGGEFSLEEMLKDTLVLGADVVHPSGGSIIGCPSIAAIVGSTDASVAKFLGSMRLQSRSNKEVIDTENVRAMVMERIKAWQKHTSSYPKKVLYYRDGVSIGQFGQIKALELPEIRKAYEAVVKRPLEKLTAICAVKRHHTRLYPSHQSNATKNGNCKPGTLVDSGITSPYFSDFYLQSHNGLQGTVKPTHYYQLENEIGYTDIQVQKLTHGLCYTYVRATLGVSYAPPIYYADRLCERGRCYLRKFFVPDHSSQFYHKYEEAKKRIEKTTEVDTEKVLRARLGSKYSTKRGEKTDPQLVEEKEGKKRANMTLEEVYFQEARKYLEETRVDGPGPWKPALDDVMFWM
ncbi:Piwi-domain-containing protein [Pleomassaria siparia CBS 279.74]|uniref:Piwi-domain-containing protein n=1 Tax=Pleomassaria siparia CBS 279.74 TaxID=1314801 RepID=A0A6G1KC55_9PLEO|nr:Piwi-domain-containing protein [Pleomassaria siparia CBS 279.74]